MKESLPIRLAIVDNEQLIVHLLEYYFNKELTTQVVFTGFTGEALLDFLKNHISTVDVLLLDLCLREDRMTDIINQLHICYFQLKVIVFSSYYNPSFIGYLLKNSINAFLPKEIPPHELLKIAHSVYNQGYYFLPEQVDAMRDQIASKPPSPKIATGQQLTDREQEVLQLICQQKTAQEIAKQLHIAKRTVEGYKNNLMSKLQLKNTAGLIIFSIQQGLVDVNSICLK